MNALPEISRRSFLRGVMAVVGTALVKPAWSLPIIRGDGIHDDTAGLNALLGGAPFHVDGEGFTASRFGVDGGKFLITDTLKIRLPNSFIRRSVFTFTPKDPDAVMLDVEGGTEGVHITYNTFYHKPINYEPSGYEPQGLFYTDVSLGKRIADDFANFRWVQ